MGMTRRSALGGIAAAPLVSACATIPSRKGWDVIVVGAGVFGAWTAEALRQAGQRVLLVDAWAPAHARASSGGESRLTRAGYGPDKIYSRMAHESLEDWKRLSRDTDLPLFHAAGVLGLFGDDNAYTPYAESSFAALTELGIAVEKIGPSELARRWPQIATSDISFGLLEPDFGALMARRSVATLVGAYIRKGGAYRQASILPPDPGKPLTGLQTAAGETLEAASFVFACGPWLARLFPDLLGDRLFATRQEILYFGPPAGDARFTAGALPGWVDFTQPAIHYGFPDLEGRGFKIANDDHGPIVDFDTNDRVPAPENIASVRAAMARRFPRLADAPLSEVRVCQYCNSANGDFLIDRHPDWPNLVLAGMGSGHGFKHGPAVGRLAAALVTASSAPEPRFTLATKAATQNRSVH